MTDLTPVQMCALQALAADGLVRTRAGFGPAAGAGPWFGAQTITALAHRDLIKLTHSHGRIKGVTITLAGRGALRKALDHRCPLRAPATPVPDAYPQPSTGDHPT